MIKPLEDRVVVEPTTQSEKTETIRKTQTQINKTENTRTKRDKTEKTEHITRNTKRETH